MAAPAIRPSAVITASIVAILTLTTFANLRDYGPESAVRRFHGIAQRLFDAQMRRDKADSDRLLGELQKFTEEDVRTPEVIQLAIGAGQFLVGDVRFQIRKVDREPNQVRAAVMYINSRGVMRPVVWVVDKVGRSWKVSARKTLQLRREAYGI